MVLSLAFLTRFSFPDSLDPDQITGVLVVLGCVRPYGSFVDGEECAADAVGAVG
jgi:hypothetical protein